MRRVIIAAHGHLAEGLKSSAKVIVGAAADDIYTYALLPGGDASDFVEEVKALIANHPDDDWMVLTDLFGASVFNAFCLLHEESNFHLLTGVNLALLLGVLLAPTWDKNSLDAIISEVKTGILQFKGFAGEEEEDF